MDAVSAILRRTTVLFLEVVKVKYLVKVELSASELDALKAALLDKYIASIPPSAKDRNMLDSIQSAYRKIEEHTKEVKK